MGVRTDYRAYSADVVATIYPGESPLGFLTRQESMTWQPPEGFSLGSGVLPDPGKIFTPVKFYPGSMYASTYRLRLTVTRRFSSSSGIDT
jgi:hypothetical protein